MNVHDETVLPTQDLPTNEQIVAWCNDPNRVIISSLGFSNEVIRINNFAIKFGLFGEQEACNQSKAFRILDQSVVRVPQVYRFFSSMNADGVEVGYLLMDFMDGFRRDKIDDVETILSITRVIEHMGTKERAFPGPLSGDVYRGLLWPEIEDITPTSEEDLENYLNSRLLDGRRLNLKGSKYVLCHLDIAPRNFLFLHDGSICLLDWASAGFYPRCFEIAALQVNSEVGRDNSQFNADLRGSIIHTMMFTEEELEVVDSILQVRYNNISLHLYVQPQPRLEIES